VSRINHPLEVVSSISRRSSSDVSAAAGECYTSNSVLGDEIHDHRLAHMKNASFFFDFMD
jgi:hypothetical protein